jgi:uncharacterized SAM-binding protein YcdF (DUF218 family)
VKTRRRILLLILVLALVGWFARDRMGAAMGRALVESSPPEKSDIIVVLAGDPTGNRILKAAELAREGYAPLVLVSGPGDEYGYHECDLAIPFAVKHGYPESTFAHSENDARSTRAEVAALAPDLRRRSVHKVLLVTSDYHTRRAGKLFRQAMPEMEVVVTAAPDKWFTPDGWWKNREGQKTFLNEWEKTVAVRLGM